MKVFKHYFPQSYLLIIGATIASLSGCDNPKIAQDGQGTPTTVVQPVKENTPAKAPVTRTASTPTMIKKPVFDPENIADYKIVFSKPNFALVVVQDKENRLMLLSQEQFDLSALVSAE